MQFDLNDKRKYRTLSGEYLWPNELTRFEDKAGNEVLLIPDGFLMPGQSDGGLFAIVNPNRDHYIQNEPFRLTMNKPGWFYHRAVHVRLPGGVDGILTARAYKPIIGEAKGELVWIPIPDDIASIYNSATHKHTKPLLQEVVLTEGPDVMFEVIDNRRKDKTIDVVAAHFFNEKLSIHTLVATENFPFIEIVRTSTIDTIGRPYGLCLTSIDDSSTNDSIVPSKKTHLLVSTHECSYDIPSTLSMAWKALSGVFPIVRTGVDGENLPRDSMVSSGGSLFSYAIPDDSDDDTSISESKVLDMNFEKVNNDRLHVRNWPRQTLFRGFKVRGWGGIISPGAPGFPYVVRMPNSNKPMILLAGDCTGSAYIFVPSADNKISLSNCKKYQIENDDNENLSRNCCNELFPKYELAFEVECGATVGSLAIHRNKDESLDLYIPSYELNKVSVKLFSFLLID